MSLVVAACGRALRVASTAVLSLAVAALIGRALLASARWRAVMAQGRLVVPASCGCRLGVLFEWVCCVWRKGAPCGVAGGGALWVLCR